MEFLYSILSTVHIVVCILLILLILLQKGTGDGLFTSSNSANPFMSGMEVATFLSTLTKYLGIFFLINTLVIASLTVKISNKNKILSQPEEEISEKRVPLGSK
jgi:preprotein translocase subunit SecG